MKKTSVAENRVLAETEDKNSKRASRSTKSKVESSGKKRVKKQKEVTTSTRPLVESSGKKRVKKQSSRDRNVGRKNDADNKDNVVEIRKYANRRLYCTTFSEYIVHEDVSKMIRDGRTVMVTDAKTGEDITRLVLAQILLDAEGKDNNPLLPLSFLQTLIGLYGNGVNHFLLPRFLEQSIKTFEDNTRDFENYLEKMFDSVDDSMTYSISNPFRNVNQVNRRVFEMNKEMVRNSMRIMMGEDFSQLDQLDNNNQSSQSSQSEENSTNHSKKADKNTDSRVSQKARPKKLTKKNK